MPSAGGGGASNGGGGGGAGTVGERVVRAGVATVVGAATCWSVWRAGAPQPSTLLPYTVLERAAEWRWIIFLIQQCQHLRLFAL